MRSSERDKDHPVLSATRIVVEAVRRVAALEYALIEACHAAPIEPWQQVECIARAGVAQVHLFDLGTALHDLGDDSLSYSRCVRHALLQGGPLDAVLTRLLHEYERTLARHDLPDGLRVLLRANVVEHTRLTRSPHDHATSAVA